MKKELLQVLIPIFVLMYPLRLLFDKLPRLMWLWTILYFVIGITSIIVIKKIQKNNSFFSSLTYENIGYKHGKKRLKSVECFFIMSLIQLSKNELTEE